VSADLLTAILAAGITAAVAFLAGMAFMGALMRRAIAEERGKLRECLDRGNRLVDANEDVIRRLRNTL